MASLILFVNQKGEEVVSRHYRSDISKAAIDAFRSQVSSHICSSFLPVLLGNIALVV